LGTRCCLIDLYSAFTGRLLFSDVKGTDIDDAEAVSEARLKRLSPYLQKAKEIVDGGYRVYVLQ